MGGLLELMHNVISKIKQNSSDMNEIILAPCDAGYVQSCTGFFQHIKLWSIFFVDISPYFDTKIRIFFKSIWYEILKSIWYENFEVNLIWKFWSQFDISFFYNFFEN
jgi:hypothetical protein